MLTSTNRSIDWFWTTEFKRWFQNILHIRCGWVRYVLLGALRTSGCVTYFWVRYVLVGALRTSGCVTYCWVRVRVCVCVCARARACVHSVTELWATCKSTKRNCIMLRNVTRTIVSIIMWAVQYSFPYLTSCGFSSFMEWQQNISMQVEHKDAASGLGE
jgi:hypothetical protein